VGSGGKRKSLALLRNRGEQGSKPFFKKKKGGGPVPHGEPHTPKKEKREQTVVWDLRQREDRGGLGRPMTEGAPKDGVSQSLKKSGKGFGETRIRGNKASFGTSAGKAEKKRRWAVTEKRMGTKGRRKW